MFVRCAILSLVLALFVILIPDAPAIADPAPRQLHNKTIRVLYTVQNTLRRMDGSTVTPPGVSIEQLFYVSSAGRIFVKRTVTGRRGTRGGEVGPDDSTTNAGAARSASFQGGKLVSIASRGGGAGRTIVSFDPSYSSCTADQQYGKPEGQAMMRRGPRGGVAELVSTSFSGQSCSIAEGNQVAN